MELGKEEEEGEVGWQAAQGPGCRSQAAPGLPKSFMHLNVHISTTPPLAHTHTGNLSALG